MRRLLIGLVAFLGLAAAASAADLARPAPPMAPPFTWTGLYVGANAGGIWSDGSFSNGCVGQNFIFGLLFPPFSVLGIPCPNSPLLADGRDSSSWLAGGQVGYNYQVRNWVFGVEADLQATDLSRSATAVVSGTAQGFPGIPFTATYRASSDIDWFGTVRGRLGVAFDRLLVYGTGGAIFANVTTSHFLDRAPPGLFDIGLGVPSTFSNLTSLGSHDAIVPGWIVGGGIEYAFANNLSLKAEGMYYELQKAHAGGTEFAGVSPLTFLIGNNAVTTEVKHHGFLARGGINWRFWGM